MEIKQFSGLANTVSQESIPVGALTDATNTDIDNAGKIRRRRGMTLIEAGGFHSLFTVSDTEGYFVKNGDLCRFTQSMHHEVIFQDVGDEPLSYARVADRVYAKSSTHALTFTSQGPAQQWGIPLVAGFAVAGSPAPGDQVAFVTQKIFGVAVTYRRDSDGLEGGVLESQRVSCNSGGITVSGIPTIPGYSASIYMTELNGNVLMLARDGVIGSATLYPASNGIPLRTRGKTPPAGAGPIAYMSGRILIADGPILWATDPYQYELVDMIGGYKMLESDITFLASVSDGVFIGTLAGVFFMSGEFDSARLTRISTHRAPRQTPQNIEMADVLNGDSPGVGVLFVTDGGVCVGNSGGQVINLTNKIFEFPQAQALSMVVRSQDGINQFVGVASHQGTPSGSARFGDFVDAEIIRFKGA